MRSLALLLLLLLTGCDSVSKTFGQRYALQDLALSPDGHLVAVRFFDHDLKKPGLGLFDWEKGRFTPIRNPAPDRGYTDPSFSPDGKSLIAVSGNQLMLIELATLKAEQLTQGGQGFREAPMFLPDGSGILYVNTDPAHFVLFNLADHSEKDMLQALIGFSTISRPYFGGPDRIIFSAAGPRIPDLFEQVAKFPDARPNTDLHIYGMKFGDLPELILNNLWTEGKKRSRWFRGEQNLQASKNAEKIVFIDYAPTSGSADRNTIQELFLIEGDQLKQLTHLNSSLIAAAISYDGMTAAFGCDSGHDMGHDLCMLDIASGKVRKIGLMGSVRSAD